MKAYFQDGTTFGLILLGLLMPAGSVVAGDGEDPKREAAP